MAVISPKGCINLSHWCKVRVLSRPPSQLPDSF